MQGKSLKKLFAVAFLVVATFLLAACGKDDGIVGKWEYETGGYIYTFNADGTGDYNGVEFTYTVEGEKLSILYNGNTSPFETTFTIKDGKLNVRDSVGNDTIYIKK